ncbi:unnamed protein product [Amoebophrya sp. A25]|nr:unnamed protein product [Amoebophrya sp. A25]|eukprot:GSA25T00011821001.1
MKMFAGKIRYLTGHYEVGCENGETAEGTPYRLFFPICLREDAATSCSAKVSGSGNEDIRVEGGATSMLSSSTSRVVPAVSGLLQRRERHVRDWRQFADGQYNVFTAGAGRLQLRSGYKLPKSVHDGFRIFGFFLAVLFNVLTTISIELYSFCNWTGFPKNLNCWDVLEKLSMKLKISCSSSSTSWSLRLCEAVAQIVHSVFRFNQMPVWCADYRHVAEIMSNYTSSSESRSTTTRTMSSFPVIVYSHGLTAAMDEHCMMCAEWASHGYRVVALQFQDGSSCQVFQYGREPIQYEVFPFLAYVPERDEGKAPPPVEILKDGGKSGGKEGLSEDDREKQIERHSINMREQRVEERAAFLWKTWLSLKKRYFIHDYDQHQHSKSTTTISSCTSTSTRTSTSTTKKVLDVKPTLAGFSYGACTSQLCARDHADEVDGVISLDGWYHLPFSVKGIKGHPFPKRVVAGAVFEDEEESTEDGDSSVLRSGQGKIKEEKEISKGGMILSGVIFAGAESEATSSARRRNSNTEKSAFDTSISSAASSADVASNDAADESTSQPSEDQVDRKFESTQFWCMSEDFARMRPVREIHDKLATSVNTPDHIFVYRGIIHMELCEFPNFLFNGLFSYVVVDFVLFLVRAFTILRNHYNVVIEAEYSAIKTGTSSSSSVSTSRSGRGGRSEAGSGTKEIMKQKSKVVAEFLRRLPGIFWAAMELGAESSHVGGNNRSTSRESAMFDRIMRTEIKLNELPEDVEDYPSYRWWLAGNPDRCNVYYQMVYKTVEFLTQTLHPKMKKE